MPTPPKTGTLPSCEALDPALSAKRNLFAKLIIFGIAKYVIRKDDKADKKTICECNNIILIIKQIYKKTYKLSSKLSVHLESVYVLFTIIVFNPNLFPASISEFESPTKYENSIFISG